MVIEGELQRASRWAIGAAIGAFVLGGLTLGLAVWSAKLGLGDDASPKDVVAAKIGRALVACEELTKKLGNQASPSSESK